MRGGELTNLDVNKMMHAWQPPVCAGDCFHYSYEEIVKSVLIGMLSVISMLPYMVTVL